MVTTFRFFNTFDILLMHPHFVPKQITTMSIIKRVKIGLVYNYNEKWVAGSYYILNLIHAINKLEDEQKPELIIFSSDADNPEVREINYPYLKFHQLDRSEFQPVYNRLENGVNRLSRILLKKDIMKKKTKKRLRLPVDLIFPASDHVYFSEVKNKLFWIPDFQEHFLPQFFSEEEIQLRKKQQLLLAQGNSIVFSSNDAAGHFKKFYPRATAHTYVLPFAVTHPFFNEISIEAILSKYGLKRPYFFCPNQVWQHKNHITVLKAIKKLKDEGKEELLVVFSGKEYDNRNPGVFEGLKTFIAENGIGENAKFLGFIDRKDQLQLMNNAVCIIQPSLFEGWSTSVEDAKAMQQYVIASDLPVHREQLQKQALFFEAENVLQLATCIKNTTPQIRPGVNNYEKDIFKFGQTFMEIVKKITGS